METTRDEMAKLILASNGKIFTVGFVKRSTSEFREMNCRLGVVKHLKGGERAYDAAEHNLICVYDMQKKGYRSIPKENLQRLVIEGKTYVIPPS